MKSPWGRSKIGAILSRILIWRSRRHVDVDCTCAIELGIMAKTSRRHCPVHGEYSHTLRGV